MKKDADYGIFSYLLVVRQFPPRLTTFLCAVVLALLSGCGAPMPKIQYQPALGRVAVVAPAQQPEIISFKNIFLGKGGGAAEGAVRGVGECMVQSPRAGPLFPVFAVLCGVVAAPAGAIIGGALASSAKDVDGVEAGVPVDLEAKVTQELLREQVVSAAMASGGGLVPIPVERVQSATQGRGNRFEHLQPATQGHGYHFDRVRSADYRSLAAEVDTVLEVALTKVGFKTVFEEQDINKPVFLIMTAHVELIRTKDNAAVLSADYVYESEQLKPAEWVDNQADRLLHALQVGYEALGSDIYDNVFLLYPFPYRNLSLSKEGGNLHKPPAFGLEPLYTRASIGKRKEPTANVDPLRPTFRWQSFPRDADFRAAPEEMVMERVKNVRYDLVVARNNDHEVIYRREGLPDTTHTIETSLSPATIYLWTVRARFEFDGRERVTEWSSYYIYKGKKGEQLVPPSWRSYSFKTPE